MIKTADRSTTDSAEMRGKKRIFFVYLFELTWKMLGGMLLPLFIGIYIDSANSSGQGFSLAGFFVGLVFSVLALRSIIKKISKERTE